MRNFDMSREFDPRAQLSKHFTLRELTKSDTAKRHQLHNIPRDVADLANLKALCTNVLEPVRQALNVPLIVTSGFRCGTLNRLVGGAPTSQHLYGEAADFVPKGMAVENAAFTLAALDDLAFDQLIYEVIERTEKPPIEWIHISHKRISTNRHQVLTIHRQPGSKRYTYEGIKPVLGDQAEAVAAE